jgi:uncharacterized protein involved in exopolysaccharide biosynthesis
MPLQRFIAVLRGRWRIALSTLAGLLVITLAASLLAKPQYKATGSVMVDTRSQDMGREGASVDSAMAQSFVATQADVILSERVIRKVIAKLNLQGDPALADRWQKETGGVDDFNAWIVRQLTQKLEVRPAKDSSIIMVSAQADSPQRAAGVVNAIIAAYADTARELRAEDYQRQNDFFKERADKMGRDLDEAKARLSSFQAQHRIVSGNGDIDTERKTLDDLKMQRLQLQSALNESNSREQQPTYVREKLPAMVNDPVIATLTSEMVQLESRLAENPGGLGRQNPKIQEQENRLASLKEQRAQQMRLRLDTWTTQHKTIARQLAATQAEVATQEAKMIGFKGSRDDESRLLRDVETANVIYSLAKARADRTDMERLVTHVNVSVLQSATPIAMAVTPKVGLNVAMAAVIGSLLAVAAVLLRERFDARLRTTDDVVNGLQVPLLAVLHSPTLPPLHPGGRLSRSKSPLLGT